MSAVDSLLLRAPREIQISGRTSRGLLVAAGTLILAVFAWIIPPVDIQAHNILHHLNFIPLMVAGMVFGLRGSLLATAFAVVAHAPHLAAIWNTANADATDQILEISIFGVAGAIAGILSDRGRAQQARTEQTKRELERVYQELQDNIGQMKKAERLYAAGQLSASLAHEIRNPLASILGAAGILKRGNSSAENVTDCLEIIETETHRLNKLLGNFLEFARPKAPRLHAADIRPVIDSVVALSTHAAGSKRIEIRQKIEQALPEVSCDPEQIRQALLNLLINAVQATEDAGAIEVSAEALNGRVVISVSDEGCGLSEEAEARIFDPFFTTKEQGTGLGLAIASKIIEQHGGTLTARRNNGRGMTFRFDLPSQRGAQ
jgi:signal transduction histidine kinase